MCRSFTVGCRLVATKLATDEISDHSLLTRKVVTADLARTVWSRHMHRLAVSSQVYQIGLMDLGCTRQPYNSVTLMQPAVDLHLYSSLLLNPTMVGAYIGFETGKCAWNLDWELRRVGAVGEFVGFRRECKYTECASNSNLTDLISYIAATADSKKQVERLSETEVASGWDAAVSFFKSTTFDLERRNLRDTCERDGEAFMSLCDGTASVSKVGRSFRLYDGIYVGEYDVATANYGSYAATAQSWYKAARSRPREKSDSRMGQPVINSISFTDGTGDSRGSLVVSFSQAFYNEFGSLIGVFKSDSSLDFLSEHLKKTLPSDDSAAVIVESHGEIVADSSLLVSEPLSGISALWRVA